MASGPPVELAPSGPVARSATLRLATPKMSRTTMAMTARSASICTVVTSWARLVFGVMSPNPTVENTVTVK